MNKEEKKTKRSPFHLSEDIRLGLPEPDFKLLGSEFPREDLDFEITFFEGIIKRNPYNEDALLYLGNAYTAHDDYAKGLDMDKRIVHMRPNDPIAFYNLACSFSLLEQVDNALKALRRAIDLGYDELDHMMEDPHLENVRRDRRFRLLVNRMKRLAAGRR